MPVCRWEWWQFADKAPSSANGALPYFALTRVFEASHPRLCPYQLNAGCHLLHAQVYCGAPISQESGLRDRYVKVTIQAGCITDLGQIQVMLREMTAAS